MFLDLCAKFGQLIVVMFLFFSGYGVMSAIRNKGAAYVQAMPRHRILTVLVNFDVAVVIFAVLQLLLGRVFPVNRYLLSLVGWEQIGNSNWYIVAIAILWFGFVTGIGFYLNAKAIPLVPFQMVGLLQSTMVFFRSGAAWRRTAGPAAAVFASPPEELFL